jgi:hypothetical protein
MGSLQTMSKVAISGNASGTGTFTIQAPNSNNDRILSLPDEAGTVLTSVSDVASSQLPAGSVLQVVQGSELGSQTAIGSTSYTDVGISVSITPSSTSSKILLLTTYHINNRRSSGTGQAGCDLQISDGSNNNVYTPTFSNDLTYYFNTPDSGDFDLWRVNTISYLDSPNTDSAITYKLRSKLSYGDYVRFRGGHITAMEIAG